MPDYSHLRRLATNAAEVVLEELRTDAEQFLLSGPSRKEMLAYACELEEILGILMYHAADLADLRKQVLSEVVAQLDEQERRTA